MMRAARQTVWIGFHLVALIGFAAVLSLATWNSPNVRWGTLSLAGLLILVSLAELRWVVFGRDYEISLFGPAVLNGSDVRFGILTMSLGLVIAAVVAGLLVETAVPILGQDPQWLSPTAFLLGVPIGLWCGSRAARDAFENPHMAWSGIWPLLKQAPVIVVLGIGLLGCSIVMSLIDEFLFARATEQPRVTDYVQSVLTILGWMLVLLGVVSVLLRQWPLNVLKSRTAQAGVGGVLGGAMSAAIDYATYAMGWLDAEPFGVHAEALVSVVLFFFVFATWHLWRTRGLSASQGATIVSHTWTDLQRGRVWKGHFGEVTMRLWVVRDHDRLLLKHQNPRDFRWLWLLRGALMLALVWYFGKFVLLSVSLLTAKLGVSGFGSGLLNWVQHSILGVVLTEVSADAVTIALWVVTMVAAYRCVWWTLMRIWPWHVRVIGEWGELSLFSVVPRADHYYGGSVESRRPEGTIILAHFKDGRNYAIAESEDAAAEVHDLHTLLVARFIDGRTEYFEQLAAAERAYRNETAGLRPKVV